MSVAIPAFNAQRFLSRTLNSALQQTYQNLEVIVVDDGSTDQTKAIAEKFSASDHRVKVVSTSNGGVAKARNVGIEASSGEFLGFLDADDLWHPTKIARQVEILTTGAHADAAATYTLMRIIDAEDRVLRNGSGIGYSGYIFARHLFARPVGNGSSLMVRREVALDLGGFDTSWSDRDLGGCEDLDFELRIAEKHRIAAIRLYLVGYRVYPGNMSSNALALARSVLSIVEHHINSHPELPDWAVRKTRAATLEYALQNIASVGQWQIFSSELARLLRIDLGRGLRYTSQFVGRKAVRQFRGNPDRSGTATLPDFYDLSPKAGTSETWTMQHAYNQRVMDQLESVDALRAEAIGHSE